MHKDYKRMSYEDQCRLIQCSVSRGIHVDEIARIMEVSVRFVMRRYRYASEKMPPPTVIEVLPCKIF